MPRDDAEAAKTELEALNKVDLAAALATFDAPWEPRIVAALNGQEVKVVKLRGAFVWHRHADADELFLVLRGSMRMELRGRTIALGEGEMFVVPRGVEHRPVADEEAHVLLFEPAGTVNTGDAGGPRTVAAPERLA
ncbi:MAG: cupin domain-containing protein [Myxococcales bacterium]|nr:cupin domain-containing protein [Myxococcales bacterium]